MAFFISVSEMEFMAESNELRRLKQRNLLMDFFSWKCEKVDLMEISEKHPLYKYGLKWKGTPGDEKIPPKYESINVKEGHQQAFEMVGSSFLWGRYEQKASSYNKSARIRNFFGDGFCKRRK